MGRVVESDSSKAIFVIKPCGINKILYGHPLACITEGMFKSAGLTVTEQTSIHLMESQIRRLYPILDVPDPVYGEGWKSEVIQHMVSAPITVYVVEGSNAEQKAKIIKNNIRACLLEDGSVQSRIVRNLAHVVDDEEYDQSYDVLFGH